VTNYNVSRKPGSDSNIPNIFTMNGSLKLGKSPLQVYKHFTSYWSISSSSCPFSYSLMLIYPPYSTDGCITQDL